MKTKLLPDWLQNILDNTGLEQGKYSFSEEEVALEGLPEQFIGIAEGEVGGLAVAEKADGVVYCLENGVMKTFAMNDQEFMLAIRRDEAWEELSENMPAAQPFWLGIVLKTRNEAGEELTLGFRGSSRDAAMVIQGEMKQEEMLEDALNRELKAALMITQFQVKDVLDEGGVSEIEGKMAPMFTVVVEVEEFDPTILGDPEIMWINMNKKAMVN